MKQRPEGKLVLKYLNHSLTPEEEERLHVWLKSDFENWKVLELLETIWNSTEKKYQDLDDKKAWENLAQKAGISTTYEEQPIQIQPISRTYSRRVLFKQTPIASRILRIAAVIVFAVSMHLFYQGMKSWYDGKSLNKMTEISVDYGKTAIVTLMDGTKITLDAGSSLSYPKTFSDDIRQVHLTGEGFFEVTSNPQKPFIIYTDDAVVKVLGTKFNVSAWPKLRNIRVAVKEGRVSFRSTVHPENKAVVIKQGEMSVLRDKGLLMVPMEADIEKHMAWLNRTLILDNTPLYEVLDQLERWYQLRFELPSPVYYSVLVSGTIKEKSIKKIIEIISMAVNLNFERVGNYIVFSEKT